tara:strand:+ start:110 stop:523 length:414 start_codon:yes stop_codon:yes gene_type:complete
MLKCFCYRNLHTGRWSLKALNGGHKGLVVMHADAIVLNDGSFRVSEVGRQRVLRERRKNVHAGAVGNVVSVLNPSFRYVLDDDVINRNEVNTSEELLEAYYNPYKTSTFVYKETGNAISSDDLTIVLKSDHTVWATQ